MMSVTATSASARCRVSVRRGTVPAIRREMAAFRPQRRKATAIVLKAIAVNRFSLGGVGKQNQRLQFALGGPRAGHALH